MTTQPQPTPGSTADGVHRLVPYAHVADVEASLAFYELLGFEPVNVMSDPGGRAFWALSKSGGAELMLARASGPIDAEQQAVLFYMYAEDVAGLRWHLLDRGLRDRGSYQGRRMPGDGPGSVFAVAHPDYMPAGEIRISDPDGYVILVGQPD